jgi:transposase
MSTSLLYHGFSLSGYHYQSAKYVKGKVIFSVSKDLNKLECPECRSKSLTRRGTVDRFFKTMPIGKKQILLHVPIHRIECNQCGCLKQEKITFADPKKTYTHSFKRYVLELSKLTTIKHVAQHLGLSWDTVKEIQKEYLYKHFRKPRLKGLRFLAIDEISIGKKHRYLTIVYDLLVGAVVFIGDGKGADALSPFWPSLKRSGACIAAVSIDMSPAYIEAVRCNLPKATVVFDHFHVIKYFNDRLSEFRRQLYHETENVQEKQILKGTRWLLLKNPDNLITEKKEREHLEEALRLNKPLATAYYMKEELRQLWNQPSKSEAKKLLSNWVAKARRSNIRMLAKFSNTISAHRTGILAYYDYRISTGPLEGTNNKIKTLQRQSYGFRDKEFFKLKILAIHQSEYALIG